MMPSLFIGQDKSAEPVYADIPKDVIGIPYRARYVSVLLAVVLWSSMLVRQN